MLHFDSDYMEGAHPKIMQRLMDTNLAQTVGYGLDEYSEQAKAAIRKACGVSSATPVYLLIGGTQTNATVISSILRSYEGVVAADTAHIATHEAGAIELGGHKVLVVPGENAKLTAQALKACLTAYQLDDTREHTVKPGMVYISHPTEYGTLYTKSELEALSAICHEAGIPLYLDGARMGYALAAPDTDVTLQVIASTCDAFYIGGTKVGALFGEAVVMPNVRLATGFFSIVKQHGALLAKGRLSGIQFLTLFEDELYEQISAHAVRLALKLKQAFMDKGYPMAVDSVTNQQFPILSQAAFDRLSAIATFSLWERRNDGSLVTRFVTSWATRESDVDALISAL